MRANMLPWTCFILSLLMVACGGNSSSPTGGTCTGTATCGGTLDGTWRFDTTCVAGNLPAALASAGNYPPACSGLFQTAIPSVSGTVNFANGTETDTMTITMDVTLLYTSACMSAAAGSTVTANASICALLGPSLIGQGGFTSATCSFASGGCACSGTIDSPADTTPQAITVSGHTITYANGSDPMDYCVAGTELTTSGGAAGLPNVTFVTTAHKL